MRKGKTGMNPPVEATRIAFAPYSRGVTLAIWLSGTTCARGTAGSTDLGNPTADHAVGADLQPDIPLSDSGCEHPAMRCAHACVTDDDCPQETTYGRLPFRCFEYAFRSGRGCAVPCISNGDCGLHLGFYCASAGGIYAGVATICKAGCNDDSDCPQPTDAPPGACVPTASGGHRCTLLCRHHGDCAGFGFDKVCNPADTCHAYRGGCAYRTCATDAECQERHGKDHVCLPDATCGRPTCSKDSDCETGMVCHPGRLCGNDLDCHPACQDDEDCSPSGMICLDGACVSGCRSDLECPEWARCRLEGDPCGIYQCVDCLSDSDCPPVSRCLLGNEDCGRKRNGCYGIDCTSDAECRELAVQQPALWLSADRATCMRIPGLEGWKCMDACRDDSDCLPDGLCVPRGCRREEP